MEDHTWWAMWGGQAWEINLDAIPPDRVTGAACACSDSRAIAKANAKTPQALLSMVPRR